jgi:hypothetical protein
MKIESERIGEVGTQKCKELNVSDFLNNKWRVKRRLQENAWPRDDGRHMKKEGMLNTSRKHSFKVVLKYCQGNFTICSLKFF